MPAAQAAECAAREGRFREFVDAVYEGQDSLGVIRWATFARRAGIRDTSAIETCAKNPAPAPRIAAGVNFANANGIEETPVLMINGWLFRGGVTGRTLDSVIAAARQAGVR